jgi:hypothetical protein
MSAVEPVPPPPTQADLNEVQYVLRRYAEHVTPGAARVLARLEKQINEDLTRAERITERDKRIRWLRAVHYGDMTSARGAAAKMRIALVAMKHSSKTFTQEPEMSLARIIHLNDGEPLSERALRALF